MFKKKALNKVCIVNCFDTYEQRVDILHDFRHFEKYQRTDIKQGFRYFHAIPYEKNISINRLKSHMALAKDIFKVVEEQKFDLLWVLVPPNSFVKKAARYKKFNSEVKLIFDLIDLWPETMPISKFKWLPPFIYWKNLRNRYLNAADEIVTECNLYHQKLPTKVKDKLHTIYLAREVKKFNPQCRLPENKIALCYLGSINNIIDIPAIADLIFKLKKFTDVELNIIGDGEKREELISSCENVGADVIYYGKIYDIAKKQRIFDSCHYGLNFMKKSVFVGLTMKSIDYFEAGLPILNNIQGDTWEIIEKENVGVNISRTTDYEQLISLSDQYRSSTREFFENNLTIKKFDEKVKAII